MNAMSCANRVPPTSVMQILCRAVMPVQRFEFLELQLTLLCFNESLELQVNWYYFAQFFRPCCSRLMLKSCGVLLKADFYALFVPPLADFYRWQSALNRYRPSLLKRCLKFLRWKNLSRCAYLTITLPATPLSVSQRATRTTLPGCHF